MKQMDEVTVGILVPMSGAAGLFGPSICDCALLAAEEINQQGGLIGARLNLEFIDTGREHRVFMRELERLLAKNCKALVGAHDSAVRNAVFRHIRGRIPYVYTPPYEGNETGKGLFILGETPYQQLSPVIPWLMREKEVNTWYMVGNSYQWPYTTNWLAKQFIGLTGGEVLGEEYVSFGSENFDHALKQIEETCPDAVLITLVGADSVNFNRSFAERGLAEKILRYGPLIEENTLLGIGVECSKGIFSSSGYFTCLQTEENRGFIHRYTLKFGENAPMLNVVGQSCYDGLHFLAGLTAKAKSLDVQKLTSVTEGFTYASPRGPIVMHNRHSIKTIYLAEAQGIDFKIVRSFMDISANAPGH